MALSEAFHELAGRVRQWGRWGDDDELGTLNLLTDEVRRRGAASVRSGRAFSLALPLDAARGIQVGALPKRVNPVLSMTMVNQPLSDDPDGACSSDDNVYLSLQGATHWDGLAHVSYGGHLWNGHPAASVTGDGASRCGIHRVRTLTGRGVLLDVARARGVDALEGGLALGPDDLDAALELARTELEPGDIVLLRTGHLGATVPADKWAYVLSSPGPSMATVEWFAAHDVAAVATDTLVFEVYPWEDPEVVMPVHLLHLVDLGLTQGQNWRLDALAEDCAEDGRYTFLLEASPLPFVGACGSPVNPVAVK